MDTSHIIDYSKYVTKFLNIIENEIPNIVDKTCFDLLSRDDNPEIKSIILYGNSHTFLEMTSMILIKRWFKQENIVKRKTTYIFDSNEIEYEFSDYHFEFDYSEKYIKFIKSIVQNKNISDKPFIFIMKNMDEVPKHKQVALRKMLDVVGNNQYIMLVNNPSKLDEAVSSRSIFINAHFKMNKLLTIINKIIEKPINLDHLNNLFYKNNHSIISVLLVLEFGDEKPKVYQYLDNLLIKMKKEKSELSLIDQIRDFIYKIYHINFPFNIIAKYIIDYYINHKNICEIIALAAECDIEFSKSNKNILIYEKFMFGLIKLVK